MSYRLSDPTASGQLELRWNRTPLVVLRILFTLASLVCLLLGPFWPEPIYLPVFLGLGALFLGPTLAMSSARHQPARMVFDNSRGQLAILDKPGDKQPSICLPYSEFERFVLVTEKHSESEAYRIALLRTDGGVWSLCRFHNETKAERCLESLDRHLQAGKAQPKQVTPPPPPVDRIEVITQPNRTQLRWGLKMPFMRGLGGLMIAGGLQAAAFGSRPFMDDIGFYILSLFACMLGALILAGILTSLGKRATLTIDAGQVQYQEHGGILRKQFSVPLRELHAVRADFDAFAAEGELLLVNQHQSNELNQLTHQEAGPMGALSLLSLLHSLPRVPAPNLSLPQRLSLEALVESHVERLSGHKPL